jgi:membrane protease YdiL (CAAX protease family)
VVFGFFLLLVLNVALAAVTMAVALPGVLSRPGFDGTDVESVIDALLTDMTRLLTTGPGVLAGGLTMWVAFFLAPWLATRHKGLSSLAKDFGFWFSWRRDILMGAAFAVGLRVVELAVIKVTTALHVDMTTAGNSDIITNLSGPWLVIDAVIVAAIGAPIFEELFFRGLVFGAFLKNFTRDGDNAKPQSLLGQWVLARLGRTWAAWASYRGLLYRWRLPLAVVISSVMFGLLHYQGSNTFGSWFVVGTTTTIGMVLAVIRHRTGRLGMAICTHILFNTSGVALALIFSGR